MKAIGLPPSDKRISQMNEAQWLWCYFNIKKDEEEQSEETKNIVDYLSFFINPEMAKSVQDEKDNKKKSKKSKKPKYRKEHINKSTEFNKEVKASSLGYDPSMGISIDEFLNQVEQNNEEEFFELEENDEEIKEFGNKNESFEDFISRVIENDEDGTNFNNDLIQNENNNFEDNNFGDEDLDIFELE